MPIQYEAKLTSVLAQIAQAWEIPGLAVGIVQNRSTIYTHYFGVQSLATHAPTNPQTRFCVASISKVFVAAAVLQLAECGRIDLDALICRYLPYFHLDDARSDQITIRQALSHTSGMPDLTDFEYDYLWKHPEWDEGAAERYVRGLSPRKMISDPGVEFHYSNIAYNVLGDLITKVSGASFEAYLREHVLLPAGMPGSTFIPAEVPPEALALPHLHTPEIVPSPFYPYHRGDAPASALHATLEDMCSWILVCQQQGSLNEVKILQPETFEQMITPVISRGYPPFYEAMALGWNIGQYQGMKTISHGGFGAGWADQLVLSPEGGWGLAILSLDESYSFLRLRQAVLDALFDQEPQAGSLSWAVPVSQALVKGGVHAAQRRAEQILQSQDGTYWLDEDLLITLALHLMIVERYDLAIEILKINAQAFPKFAATSYYQAYALLQLGELKKAEETLLRALSLQPEDRDSQALLVDIRKRSS